MRIFLVRHGQSMGNVDKTVHETMADHAIPLSDAGHKQAEAAGEAIYDYFDNDSREYFDRTTDDDAENYGFNLGVWTSPYLRTRQTTHGLRRGFNKHAWDFSFVKEDVCLVEQQFGLFDGIPDEQLPALFPREHAYYKKCEDFEGRFWARMPMGESRFDVALRVKPFFGTLIRDKEKHGIDNVVVVAHGVTLRAFAMQWLHLPFEWFEKEENPKNCSIRLIENNVDKGYIFPGF